MNLAMGLMLGGTSTAVSRQFVSDETYYSAGSSMGTPARLSPSQPTVSYLLISMGVRPFVVEVVSDDDRDNYVATFREAGISASGDDMEEALANLRDIMIAKLEHFSSLAPAVLGPGPKEQLAVLQQYVQLA